jgi:hypothetical protein
MKDVAKRPLAALGTLAVASVLSGSGFAADVPDISGIWWATEYHPAIQVLGGGELPLTAAGKAAYEKNMAGLKDGSIIDYPRKFCTPDGVPRVLANPYPFEIVQAPPGQVTFLYEPIHGSAFDIAGKGIANPVGTFWTATMMLDHLGEKPAAARLMRAIEKVTADPSLHTPDLGGTATTRKVTDATIAAIRGDNA